MDGCYIHPKILTLHHQSITCFVLWKKARGGKPTFTGQECVLLFKGGRRLDPDRDTLKKIVPSAVLFWNSLKFSHAEFVNSMKQKIGGTTFWLPLVHVCVYTWINIWPSYISVPVIMSWSAVGLSHRNLALSSTFRTADTLRNMMNLTLSINSSVILG
jgi:hypothetical protein